MQNNRINALSQHHLVIPDCDDIGNLKVAYVFVQYVGVEIEEEIDHLLICSSCNKEAESLQQILMQGTVESIFLEQQKQKYCIHSRTLTKFSPESYFEIRENSFPWYFHFKLDLGDEKSKVGPCFTQIKSITHTGKYI